MRIISHRGNLEGPNLLKENHPDQIKKVLDLGFNVEIDVWINNDNNQEEILFGHDKPVYGLSDITFEKLFCNYQVWFHCKNLEMLNFLSIWSDDCHYFWHQNDDYTLTDENYIWTYPGKELSDRSILVLPEKIDIEYKDIKDKGIYGVCTDYPLKWKEEIG